MKVRMFIEVDVDAVLDCHVVEEFTCKYCGARSEIDPSDQTPPPDYCHPEDHRSID